MIICWNNIKKQKTNYYNNSFGLNPLILFKKITQKHVL